MQSFIVRTVVLTFVSLVALLGEKTEASLAKGFGEKCEWRSLKNGLAKAKSSGKPLMLIIHKPWCVACKALKPEFAKSNEIAALSKEFIMVNIEDDEDGDKKEFNIDGRYIPRIFFLDSSGAVQQSIYNTAGNPQYKYYYRDTRSIVDSMKKLLETLSEQENNSAQVPEQESGSSQPEKEMGSPQPAQHSGSSQPAEETDSSQPAQETGSTQPAQGTGSTQPAQGTGATQPAKETGSTPPAQKMSSTQAPRQEEAKILTKDEL